MDWITGIQEAINYIEDHITEELDYGEISRRSFSSPYHFQRVFSLLCGCTLGEYIRLRRLTLAGAELAQGREKVIEIAMKYGYESPDSFAKAFTKFHGITPSEARIPGARLQSFARLSIHISLKGGTTMNYRIEDKPAFTLTGYKRRFIGAPGQRDEQEQAFYTSTRVNQYILEGLAATPDVHFNVIRNIDDSGYDFYIAAELPDHIRTRLNEDCVLGAEYASRFEQIPIPAQTYAIFETEKCDHPTLHHNALRRRIAEEWLPSSGYELTDAPEIVMSFWYRDSEKRNQRMIKLWIPVRRK